MVSVWIPTVFENVLHKLQWLILLNLPHRPLLFVLFYILFHIERTFDADFRAETSKFKQRDDRRLRKQRRAVRNRRTIKNIRRSSVSENPGEHVRLQIGPLRAEQEAFRGQSWGFDLVSKSRQKLQRALCLDGADQPAEKQRNWSGQVKSGKSNGLSVATVKAGPFDYKVHWLLVKAKRCNLFSLTCTFNPKCKKFLFKCLP